jgi:hypothetical protein
MRKMIIENFIKYAEGQIAKRKVNVENIFKNSVGIGEHSDIIESLEMELEQMAKYDEQIIVLKKYFVNEEAKEVTQFKEEYVTDRKKY